MRLLHAAHRTLALSVQLNGHRVRRRTDRLHRRITLRSSTSQHILHHIRLPGLLLFTRLEDRRGTNGIACLLLPTRLEVRRGTRLLQLLTRLEVRRGTSRLLSMTGVRVIRIITQLRQGGPAWPSTYSTIFFLAQYNEHVIDFFHAIGAPAHDTSSGSAFYSDDPDISQTQYLMTQQSYGGALQTPPPQPTQDTQEDMAPHLYGFGHRQPHGPHPRLSPSGRRPRPPTRRARTRVVRDDA